MIYENEYEYNWPKEHWKDQIKGLQLKMTMMNDDEDEDDDDYFSCVSLLQRFMCLPVCDRMWICSALSLLKIFLQNRQQLRDDWFDPAEDLLSVDNPLPALEAIPSKKKIKFRFHEKFIYAHCSKLCCNE